jgi:hypothetical protein
MRKHCDVERLFEVSNMEWDFLCVGVWPSCAELCLTMRFKSIHGGLAEVWCCAHDIIMSANTTALK